MSISREFTDQQKTILRRVEALMQKAAGNTTEHEAAAATELAMSLLAKYNLSQADIGPGQDSRSDTKILGGSLQYERDLWRAIAQLNFCWYYTVEVFFKTPEEIKAHRGRKSSRHHRLIGRTVNIRSTQMMADYLMKTLERLTREYCVERFGRYQNRSSDATAFREGATRRLIERIEHKRWLVLAEERERARKEAERAAEARPGTSGGTALALASLTRSEYARNYDFMYGEGAYAKTVANAERYEAEEAEREKAREAWCRAHPEEAARLRREAAKRAEKESRRQAAREIREWKEEQEKLRNPAYAAGLEKGGEIGLDAQVSDGNVKPRASLGSGES